MLANLITIRARASARRLRRHPNQPPPPVLALRQKLGVPHILADFKVDTKQRELIGDMAIVDPTAGGNPIELTRARALDIFDRAFEGRL